MHFYPTKFKLCRKDYLPINDYFDMVIISQETTAIFQFDNK